MPKISARLLNSIAQFRQRLNIRYPIFQAPMAGGATTPELVAAVSNAGGLGSLAGGYLSAATLAEQIQRTKALTQAKFAVNVFSPVVPYLTMQENTARTKLLIQRLLPVYKMFEVTPPSVSDILEAGSLEKQKQDFAEQIAVIESAQVPVVSFTFGMPALSVIEKLKQANNLILGTANSYIDAELLARMGCDAVIAQSVEAGGHRGGFQKNSAQPPALSVLISQIQEHAEIPLIAAGGMVTPDQVARVLESGVVAVQLGTAFLFCQESGASKTYQQALLEWGASRTTQETVGLTGKAAHGLQNQLMMALNNVRALPDYPFMHFITAPIRQAAAKKDKPEFLSLWSGRGISHIAKKPGIYQQSAGTLVEYLGKKKPINSHQSIFNNPTFSSVPTPISFSDHPPSIHRL